MESRRPAEAFPAGDFLREELEARGWTQADLAVILGRPAHTINEIVQGKRGISAEMATALAAALGTSAEYWMNLDARYQLWRAGAGDDEDVSRRARMYSLGPIKEMMRRGWLKETKDTGQLERSVVEFFEMGSLEEEPESLAHAARRGTPEVTTGQRAWLFRARKLARTLEVSEYSEGKLEAAVKELRLQLGRAEDVASVPRILREAGIRFVVVEHLTGTRIDGACFWIDGSPVVAVSLRYDRIDNFWFVVLHELGHVKEKDAAGVVDTDLEKAPSDVERPERERRADRFATETLVAQEQLEAFVVRVGPHYSAEKVERFARSIAVHPGIVIGQLQHRGEVAWSAFRSKLVPIRQWVTEAALTDGWGRRVPASA